MLKLRRAGWLRERTSFLSTRKKTGVVMNERSVGPLRAKTTTRKSLVVVEEDEEEGKERFERFPLQPRHQSPNKRRVAWRTVGQALSLAFTHRNISVASLGRRGRV